MRILFIVDGKTGVASPPTSEPAPKPNPGNVYYDNCTAVIAAGAAPLYKGQPGYSSNLDRDGDGVACEK
ncbi:excalibur calcium-binding domain-containing protein [Paenibacillus sacheonensis]|nr:excalibur calcium-binding domain-containing protein [Paenibacillus sacheonensis]